MAYVAADRRVVARRLRRVEVVDAPVRHALGLPVLQPDGVDEDQPFYALREYQPVPHRHHAAHRMAHDGDVLDSQGPEQAIRVQGKLLQTELIRLGLGRLAEAYLVGQDHTVARRRQFSRRRLPGGPAEVFPMKSQHNLPVGLASGCHVHERHLEFLVLGSEPVELHRPRIREIGAVEVLWERAIINRTRPRGDSGREA